MQLEQKLNRQIIGMANRKWTGKFIGNVAASDAHAIFSAKVWRIIVARADKHTYSENYL